MKRTFSLLTLCLIGPLTLGGCGTVSKLFGDDGPPKTPSHPGSDGFPGRFYRVVVWEGAP